LTHAARPLAAVAVAAVLLVVRPGGARADAYDYIAADAMETSGDQAKLREGWTDALGNATTGDLRSLQKRLGDLHLRIRELTSDPQIRKRIESVESLKAAKGQLDRLETP
jgi:hypothetical protein